MTGEALRPRPGKPPFVLTTRVSAHACKRAVDHDERMVPEGRRRVLAAYYQDTRQELAARRCEWRGDSFSDSHTTASARLNVLRQHIEDPP